MRINMSLIDTIHKRLDSAKSFNDQNINVQRKQLYQYAAKLKSRGNPLNESLLEERKGDFFSIGSIGIKLHNTYATIYLGQHNFLTSVFHHSEIPNALETLNIIPFQPSKRAKFFPLDQALTLFLYGKTREIPTQPAPKDLDENLIKGYLGVYYLQFLEVFEKISNESSILRYI